MVDFAMDVHGTLYPDQEVPGSLVDKRAMVVEKFKELQAETLNDYLSKYKLVTEFNEDEFAHWFMPRKNIIDTFVVEKDGKVTDMVSFYTLP